MKGRSTSRSVPLVAILALAACGPAEKGGTIHASGHIEATEVRLAAKVGGRLELAPLQEGDEVGPGDLVARLDSFDAQHELARARAQVNAVDAQLRLLLSGTRAEDLRAAEEQLAQAQAELDAAGRDLRRLEGLAERGTATEKALDDARTRHQVAERRVAGLQASVDKLVAGPRRQEIDAVRAQKAAAEAAVAALDQRISDATVIAPRAGVITERIAEPGEIISPGRPLAVLTDLGHPWLNVYVDEPSLASVRLGDPVRVAVDGTERQFTGRVTYVSRVAEFTPKNVQTPEERAKLVFRVKVALDNTDGIFKPGMPADAFFSPGELAALQTGGAPANSPNGGSSGRASEGDGAQ